MNKYKETWLTSDQNKFAGKSVPVLLFEVMGDDYIQMKEQILKEKYKVEVKRFGDSYLVLNIDDREHTMYNFKRDVWMKFTKNSKGYYKTCYSSKNSTKGIFLHVLKASCFIRPLKKNEVVHHVNFSVTDCSLDNLVIMDRKRHQSLHAAIKRFNKLNSQLKKFAKQCKNVNYNSILQNTIDELLTQFEELGPKLKNVKIIE